MQNQKIDNYLKYLIPFLDLGISEQKAYGDHKYNL